MHSFSLFAFSYPQDWRESLSSLSGDTHERIRFLRSECKEVLLAEGAGSIDQIKKLILDSKGGNYSVLYCNCGNGFVFSADEKITEMLLRRKKRVVFRIFSEKVLQLPEMLLYLIYKGLDVNAIQPYGRPRDSGTPRPVTRFDCSGPSV